jgi:hypothetical protein
MVSIKLGVLAVPLNDTRTALSIASKAVTRGPNETAAIDCTAMAVAFAELLASLILCVSIVRKLCSFSPIDRPLLTSSSATLLSIVATESLPHLGANVLLMLLGLLSILSFRPATK